MTGVLAMNSCRSSLIAVTALFICGCSPAKVEHLGCTWTIPKELKAVAPDRLLFSNLASVPVGQTDRRVASVEFITTQDPTPPNVLAVSGFRLLRERRIGELLFQEYEHRMPEQYQLASVPFAVLSKHGDGVVFYGFDYSAMTDACFRQLTRASMNGVRSNNPTTE